MRMMRFQRGLKRLQIDLVVALFMVSRSGEAVLSESECLLMARSVFKRFVDESLLAVRCGPNQLCLPSHQLSGPEVHIDNAP